MQGGSTEIKCLKAKMKLILPDHLLLSLDLLITIAFTKTDKPRKVIMFQPCQNQATRFPKRNIE